MAIGLCPPGDVCHVDGKVSRMADGHNQGCLNVRVLGGCLRLGGCGRRSVGAFRAWVRTFAQGKLMSRNVLFSATFVEMDSRGRSNPCPKSKSADRERWSNGVREV